MNDSNPARGSRRPAGGQRRDAGGTRRGNYPPKRPAPSIPAVADPARRAALAVLRAVGERDAYANLVLPVTLRQFGLEGRDAAFATELAYGSLRGRGTYDAILQACSQRSIDGLDPGVLDVLRLGAHQVLAMRTPAHAAVSATVGLCLSLIHI